MSSSIGTSSAQPLAANSTRMARANHAVRFGVDGLGIVDDDGVVADFITDLLVVRQLPLAHARVTVRS
jgi:hypothetical protein